VPTYKIFALDGGGIRGVLTAALIKKLDEQTHFLQAVDLFAGTSTGGLLALAFAAGIDVQAIIYLDQDHGPEIFSRRPGASFPRPVLRNVFTLDCSSNRINLPTGSRVACFPASQYQTGSGERNRGHVQRTPVRRVR
jgi:patatin-like phospholipase/acyl hydrolase